MAEEVFLQESGVLVTNTRFSHGPQTYAMANVTSVRATSAGIAWAIIFIVVGVFLLIGKVFIVGGPMLLIGVAGIFLRQHFVVLHTSGGEQRALASRSRDFIERVVASVQSAIVHRG